MAKEQEKQNAKLSYDELEHVAAQMQQQLSDAQAQLRNVNEIREMAFMCIELLKCKDALPEPTLHKVVNFLDRLIPIPKDNEEKK